MKLIYIAASLIIHLVLCFAASTVQNFMKVDGETSRMIQEWTKIDKNLTKFVGFAKIVHERNFPYESSTQKILGEKLSKKCSACLFLVALEKKTLGNEHTEKGYKNMLGWIEKGCEYLDLESGEVCKGMYKVFGEEIAKVLSKVDLTPEELCGLSMREGCPSLRFFTPSFNQWKVSIPPKTNITRKVKLFKDDEQKQTNDVLNVLHLSDVHIDMKYLVGGVTNCDEPVCCRKPFTSNEASFLHRIENAFKFFFDGKSNQEKSSEKAMKWGDYRNCDLPSWTFEDLLIQLARNITSNNIDYIIFTGDIPAHDIWDQSKYHQIYMNFKVAELVKKYFPNTPVYPAIGNHDTFPANSFPPSDLKLNKNFSVDWFYKSFAEAWKSYLPIEAIETIHKGGFYTVLIKPGYRIVSLNTNLCYTQNYWLYLEKHDPEGMLTWFVNVLYEAEANNELVQVIGHIPPGRDPECLRTWSENFFRIIERFHNTIAGQFYGHTHLDEVQIFYDFYQNPISVAYIAPSVTPYNGMKPSYRVYEVEGFNEYSQWSVLNHQTFVMNLIEANSTDKPRWYLEYDACKSYNITTLTPENWDKMVKEWINYMEGELQEVPQSLRLYLRFYQNLHPFVNGTSYISSDEEVDLENAVCDLMKNTNVTACPNNIVAKNN